MMIMIMMMNLNEDERYLCIIDPANYYCPDKSYLFDFENYNYLDLDKYKSSWPWILLISGRKVPIFDIENYAAQMKGINLTVKMVPPFRWNVIRYTWPWKVLPSGRKVLWILLLSWRKVRTCVVSVSISQCTIGPPYLIGSRKMCFFCLLSHNLWKHNIEYIFET